MRKRDTEKVLSRRSVGPSALSFGPSVSSLFGTFGFKFIF